MISYLLRRMALVVPTLLCIIVINFIIVQAAPGGPVEQAMARMQGFGGTGVGQAAPETGSVSSGGSRASRGLDPELIKELERQYGFDKPPHERLWLMLKNYASLDFGTSFFRGAKVTDLILEKLPVSLSLGLWATLITYLVSIPLGIRKAVRDGTGFDAWTSGVVLVGYAIPGFLFAILLVVVFAGGSFFQWFPLRGLVSSGSQNWPFWERALDYAWHMVLPTVALVVGGFAGLVMLTKNSFM